MNTQYPKNFIDTALITTTNVTHKTAVELKNAFFGSIPPSRARPLIEFLFGTGMSVDTAATKLGFTYWQAKELELETLEQFRTFLKKGGINYASV